MKEQDITDYRNALVKVSKVRYLHSSEDIDGYKRAVQTMHRTEQQNLFMAVRLIIEALSDSQMDARNEVTVKSCREFLESHPDFGKYVPYI